MYNILTIDVEDWYQTQDLNIPRQAWGNYEERIVYTTKIALDILAEYNTKATFFVLGYVAKKHPALVQEIVSRGHEIGSHGSNHIMVNHQNPQEFKEDILAAKGVIEDIVGEQVKLYRAASWSISSETLWALEILEEAGFLCDSSIQPFKTYMSGTSGAPTTPFYPIIRGRQLKLLEVPSTVLEWGWVRIPFAGGLYLRIAPLSILKWALTRVNQGQRKGLVYVHPWELDPNPINLKVSLLTQLTHYYNLSSTERKLRGLLTDFEFCPLGSLLGAEEFAAISL